MGINTFGEAAAGVEVEGAGLGVVLGAFADLGDRIDKVAPAVSSRLLSGAQPIIRTIGGSLVTTTANPDILIVNSHPMPGRIWNVRKIGLFGNDGHSAVGSPGANSISGGGGSVVPAGAGTVIATVNITTAGTYAVTVSGIQVAGPVAADRNNMGLYVNGVLNQVLPADTNTAASQSETVNISLNAGDVLTVRQIAATTATGYYAVITATPLSAGTVIADVYAGSDIEAADFSCQFMTGVPIPTIETFGRDRIRVKTNDKIYALVYNVPAGQQLVAVAEIEEFPIQSKEAMSI